MKPTEFDRGPARVTNRKTFLIGGVVVVGAAGLGIYTSKHDTTQPPSMRIQEIQPTKDGIEKQVGDHLSQRQKLEGAFVPSNTLAVPGDHDKIAENYLELQRMALDDHIEKGMYLALKYLPPELSEGASYDRKKKCAKIDGVKFNLSMPLHRHVAAAVLDAKLEGVYDPEIEGSFLRQEDINDLLSLNYNSPSVTIGEGSFGAVPIDKLLVIARLYNLFSEKKLPFPEQVVFSPYNQKSDNKIERYSYQKGVSYKLSFPNREGTRQIVSDFAHYLGTRVTNEPYDESTSIFSLKAFKSWREVSFRAVTNTLPLDIHTQPAYIEAFTRYFYEGDKFRKDTLENKNSDERLTGISDYYFFKAHMPEFRNFGVRVEHVALDEVLSRGAVYELSHTDFLHPQVLLQAVSPLTQSEHDMTLYDRDQIQILGGPVSANQKKSLIHMWNVKKVEYDPYRKEFKPYEVVGLLPHGEIGRLLKAS